MKKIIIFLNLFLLINLFSVSISFAGPDDVERTLKQMRDLRDSLMRLNTDIQANYSPEQRQRLSEINPQKSYDLRSMHADYNNLLQQLPAKYQKNTNYWLDRVGISQSTGFVSFFSRLFGGNRIKVSTPTPSASRLSSAISNRGGFTTIGPLLVQTFGVVAVDILIQDVLDAQRTGKAESLLKAHSDLYANTKKQVEKELEQLYGKDGEDFIKAHPFLADKLISYCFRSALNAKDPVLSSMRNCVEDRLIKEGLDPKAISDSRFGMIVEAYQALDNQLSGITSKKVAPKK